MSKSKLYKLLHVLSKRELQDFRLFLLSPYHNQSQTILALFDYIRPFHPDFNHKKLERNLIFTALKPNKPFDNKYVVDRLSDLNRLAEDFLAIQYIKKTPKENRAAFRKMLLKRQDQERYLQETNKEIDKLSIKPRLGWEYSLELWSLHHAVFTHPHTQLFDAKTDDVLFANKYLDETYAILKLRYGLHQLFRAGIFSDHSTIPFLDSIIEQYATSGHPIIQLYLHAIAYFTKENQQESWEAICTLFLDNIELLPPDEKVVFLFALANAGNKLAKNKSSAYYGEILLLYQKGLEHKFWEFLGDFPSITFKNIASIGAFTKENVWTYHFIDTYKQFLQKNEKEDTVAYALAYLEFYSGHYQKALDYLNQAPLLKLEDKLRNRSLQCRCLYELDSVTLHSCLDNFTTFLKNQAFKNEVKQSYKNLIYAIRLLNKNKGKYGIDTKAKEVLRTKLEKRTSYIAYDWIMQKLEEL